MRRALIALGIWALLAPTYSLANDDETDPLLAARSALHLQLEATLLEVTPTPPSEKAGRRQRRLARKRSIPVGVLRIDIDGTRHDVELYDDTGRMLGKGFKRLNALLDPTGLRPPLAPRLAALLYLLVRDYDRSLTLVHVHTDHAEGRHAHGQAVDFYIDKISTDRLYAHIQTRFQGVGVGLRVHTQLIHLDVRENTLHWTDFAGPGLAGIERIDGLETEVSPEVDPTLETPHLTAALLHPLDHPPTASIEIDPEDEKKSARKRKKKRKRRRRRKTYTVKRGDTVSGIAKKFDVSTRDIIRWNKLDKKATIRRGQKLTVRK